MTRHISVRSMEFGDLEAVSAVAKRSFSRPWGEDVFGELLERPLSCCLVAEQGDQVVGYLAAARYGDEWHLTSIAVKPAFRRAGVGGEMLAVMLCEIGPDSRLTLEVRASNEEAISFYLKRGFLAAGRRVGYYPDTNEDAVVMWRTPATIAGNVSDVPNADGTGF